MTPPFKSFLAVTGLLIAGFLLGTILFGCASAQPKLPHRNPAESFDQSNLKRLDSGCPTAIFTAPDGELQQCEMYKNAAPAAPTVKDDEVRVFPTMDAAALYVVEKIYERSHYYEFGGVIVKGSKGFMISLPSTQHHGMDVSFDEDPESFDYLIVATYHVHPCLKNAFPSVFSPQDMAGSRITKSPGYVLDECTGDLHYWAPGDGYLDADALLKLGVNPVALMQGVQLSPGKIVGHIAVDGIVLN
jgi:hypothetical protein